MRLTRLGTAILACVCTCWGASAAGAPGAVNSETLTADTKVAADGSSVETIHSEKHAVNDAGALMASRAALGFNARTQELEIVEAHTLKKDGTTIPVDLSSVYEQLQKDAGHFSTYADLRTKVVLFPQFAAGDTAVFTARLKTPHPILEGQFFQARVFPRSTGFADVNETITAPRTMTLYIESHDVEFSKREEGGNIVYSWHHAQNEPRPATPVIVSAIDREPRFFVSTFRNYSELGRAYARLSEPKIVVTDKTKALADQITAGETDRREQARKIFEWVSRNIRYVAIELGRGSLEPHEVDFILANGYGDCKDHDTLLRALLKAKGITSASILINSGNAYTLTDVPSFMQLNHVITWLPEYDAYLDSSFSMAPFGILPMGEYGKPAVRVSNGAATRITMPVLPAGLSTVTTTVNQHVDSAGLVTGTSTTVATGPSSIILRVEGLALQTVGPEKAADLQLIVRGFKSANGTANIGSPMQLAPDYTISTSISAPGWSDWLAGNARRTMPGAATVLNAELAMGPLYLTTSDSEATPCSSVHAVEDVSLALPPQTSPAQIPGDVKLQSSNISFTAHWSFADGTLSLHRDYASRFDAPLCSGRVRTETAAILKKINETYQTQLQLHQGGARAEMHN
jgi:transglutaminase-like putative cysteine protease